MEKPPVLTYPYIPRSRWWELRKKWRQSPPTVTSPKAIAVTLGMEERSARLNIFNSLIRLGLIDKDGRLTERARDWREDDRYPETCKRIKQDVYPQELIELAPGPEIDRVAVERWFRVNANVGEDFARKMAGVYELLSEADPAKAQESGKPTATLRPIVKKTRGIVAKGSSIASPQEVKIKATEVPASSTGSEELATPPKVDDESNFEPSIHIDIQIHISSDASAEQIDQVFASMAKHLYPHR